MALSKDWAATLNRFFTKTHREVRPALCGVGSRHVNYEFHELSSKRFRSYDCFNGPENLQNVLFFPLTRFLKHLTKWEDFVGRSDT